MVKNTYLIKSSSHNQLRHCNVPPNHRPAFSLISQQHCQPRAGHDSRRNKDKQAYTQPRIHNTADQPSQHSWFFRAIKELGKANVKLVSSLKSYRHQHQNQSGFQNTHTHPTQGNQSLLCNVVPQTLISTVMSPTLRQGKRTLLYIKTSRHLAQRT